jgi:hypothetical protein
MFLREPRKNQKSGFSRMSKVLCGEMMKNIPSGHIFPGKQIISLLC